MSSYFAHRKACVSKQLERKSKLDSLPAEYSTPCTDHDNKILSLSLTQLVAQSDGDSISPSAILSAYGKRCVSAQAATNCLTDVMFDEAERVFAPGKPLSGVPVSLKDCVDIAGHDTTLGYSANANRPAQISAPIVHLLQDAGALIHAKTTVPTGLLSFECSSDLFGTTTNPYNPEFSPGASTGGGAALLAYQGSMVEIGTDLGGSTRYPAAYCGVYAVKGSVGRFPTYGCQSCMPGMETVAVIASPLARSLDDLEEFWRRVVDMRPWEYDHTCVPLPWRPVDFVLAGRKPKFGVIWDDGVIPPTPACARALAEVVNTLKKQGHEVIDFSPPSPTEILKIGFQLTLADGGLSLTNPLRTGESISPASGTVLSLIKLPRFWKRWCAALLRLISRPVGRNETWASLLEVFHTASVAEERELIVQKEQYKAAWHRAWRDQELDFVLTVPHALPPIPKNKSATEKATLVSANYTFLYNILDCTTGVQPVAFVDETLDSRSADFQQSAAYSNMNDIARAVHDLYDAKAMHGLPLAVQVVGRRLEEEKVLEGMKVVERALWETGRGFVPKRF